MTPQRFFFRNNRFKLTLYRSMMNNEHSEKKFAACTQPVLSNSIMAEIGMSYTDFGGVRNPYIKYAIILIFTLVKSFTYKIIGIRVINK